MSLIIVLSLNVLPCSPLFLETENTSPSFTLKGQWWYPLTTKAMEIPTDIAAFKQMRTWVFTVAPSAIDYQKQSMKITNV